ncbi:polyprenol phosphomannose-dependent alpha 1,6 mannosyltransferase MptB [Corynebacterium sp. CCM 8835]|uniref:Polyprenol phosphomannose-dependent alpha 1,6 mannosyltransferase MptB n=1 Tax=Corynebacterium antarcticum TaxID=2800405 RepID=A0ABS1FKH7_9CORY|nr:polyprenol phosphomannose-dependent alpha 1,6 mannosyltransferase MptB [Corynebacterium antarcticum]MCL0244687.1 polyprenol phosphomannose-dependent alpha 1,6 mannosyltransferase MptB [Corynebacterium antarcticum]MCX7539757.1 polyprenol phosphomannose-dependent alpha 1,6 mannosyltransferase MptB [Corynebacterium antarcticum]
MSEVPSRRTVILRALTGELPRLGSAGSRSASLHRTGGVEESRAYPGTSVLPVRFALLRWMGTVGALMLSFGALGAGALPVTANVYRSFPGGSLMQRMLQTSSTVALTGVALIVIAWVLMAPYVGASILGERTRLFRVSAGQLYRTFAVWMTPIALSAPMFTQDIYSYLAQGAITARGLDPYSAGPVDLLGSGNPLARSVPLIWSHSPSPYGPVASGISAVIYHIAGESVFVGVYLHRLVAVLGIAASGWALSRLASRCGVSVQAALWLGMLNPLTLLHLVGGIHNESVLLGLLLVGMETGLRGVDRVAAVSRRDRWTGWSLFAVSGVLIAGAGMVKITGFIALGFTGMALARSLRSRGVHPLVAVVSAGLFQAGVMVGSVVALSAVTGIGLGWVTGQGGAVAVRSWMSATTALGVIAGGTGMLAGLGDQTTAMLSVTRAVGVTVAGVFMLRMLIAVYRGTIHAVGGLGISTFVLVLLFPVVQPWYMLWAILPLAAWANRPLFRVSATVYSAVVSFFVLPRGLPLPPGTVAGIYLSTVLSTVAVTALLWWAVRRWHPRVLDWPS